MEPLVAVLRVHPCLRGRHQDEDEELHQPQPLWRREGLRRKVVSVIQLQHEAVQR